LNQEKCMGSRSLHWVNTPVLAEALMRYEQNRLPRSMKLWVEQLLELSPQDSHQLLSHDPDY
ncbi:MAG: hypothetical protein VYE16_06965, partial [Cyanobacteriota bacterium]|nr:hypothetical protein [Cyanobacteriota bacterium]